MIPLAKIYKEACGHRPGGCGITSDVPQIATGWSVRQTGLRKRIEAICRPG